MRGRIRDAARAGTGRMRDNGRMAAPLPRNRFLAFLVRLALSAAVLWAAVAVASPGNPYNSLGRAALVSVALSIAYELTLVRFLWILVLPWLVYVAIWLAVVMGSYGIGFFRALLLALVLAFLSWAVSAALGVRPFRSG
jgi:putative membrane protein